jgi:transcriptional regulator with XRE-family HTH domain
MYERIKLLCANNGTSISKLCQELTGNSANLATWVKGNFKAEMIIRIAEYFNVSTDYLLLGVKTTLSEEEKQLVSLISQLTDEEVKELSSFVDYIISKRK